MTKVEENAINLLTKASNEPIIDTLITRAAKSPRLGCRTKENDVETYFLSECPTCARKLEIRVELLGKLVQCQQCGAVHEANDGSSRVRDRDASERRIEQALARAKEYIASIESLNSATSE